LKLSPVIREGTVELGLVIYPLALGRWPAFEDLPDLTLNGDE
jgi:hypothetical protein